MSDVYRGSHRIQDESAALVAMAEAVVFERAQTAAGHEYQPRHAKAEAAS
jgi:hypothetical protein